MAQNSNDTDESQIVLAEFIVKDVRFDGVDYSKDALEENNKLFFINSASAVTVTVPNLAIGFTCQLIQTGAGTITMTGSGTTLNSASGLSTRTTNSVIGLVMNSSTTGYVFGDTIY
mgnify:CR=1 FL=1